MPCARSTDHRGAHDDPLHRVVRRGAAGLRRALAAVDRDLPSFVWRELSGTGPSREMDLGEGPTAVQ